MPEIALVLLLNVLEQKLTLGKQPCSVEQKIDFLLLNVIVSVLF